MVSRFQVQQLEEDGGGSTRQSWMDGDKLSVAHAPPGAKRLNSSESRERSITERLITDTGD